MGMDPYNVPSVPVNVAERVYVALAHTCDYIDEHDEFPPGMVANLREVCKAYDRDRMAAMGVRGISPEGVSRYTAAAAKFLIDWLEKRAAKNEEAEGDFDRWQEELTGDDHS